MRKFSLISFLIIFMSCTHEVEIPLDNVYCGGETRSEVGIEMIDESPILNKLQAYNDAQIASLGESTNELIIGTKKISDVELADIVGFAVGYGMGKSAGSEVALIIGSMMSAQASIEKAKQLHYKETENLEEVTFKRYENFYSAVIHDKNYKEYYDSQILLLGELNSIKSCVAYLTPGINHNLLINKYRQGLLDSDITIDLFSSAINKMIYSQKYQSLISKYINQILSNSIDYLSVFSDYEKQTTSLSQMKAGEILHKYIELLQTTKPSISKIKDIMTDYTSVITSSNEIADGEKIALLNSIPIALTSTAYWNSSEITQ